METKDILGIAGLIGLGFLVTKKFLRKEKKTIIGSFKYPGEVKNIMYVGNDFDCILVNDQTVYYSGKMPNLSKVKNKDLVNTERKAEELVISLKDIAISDIHTMSIEKKEDGYFAIVLRKSTTDVTSGYLLKEEEG